MNHRLLAVGVLMALIISLVRITPATARLHTAETNDELVAYVPNDAAFFAQLRPADLWSGPVGQSIQTAKIPLLKDLLMYADGLAGLQPNDIEAMSFYLPLEFGDSPFKRFGVSIALKKPLEKNRVITTLTIGKIAFNQDRRFRFEFSEVEGVLQVRAPELLFGTRFRAELDKEAENKQPEPQILVDWRNPRLIHIAVNANQKPEFKKANEPNALAPVLELARAGKPFVFGLSMAALPPEVRNTDDLPAEVRPFAPIVKSDLFFASASPTEGVNPAGYTVEARVRSGNAVIVRDAEKSLAALMQLLGSTLNREAKQIDKDQKLDSLVELLEGTVKMLESATIRIEGTDAVARGVLPGTLPYGPALATMLNTTTASGGPPVVSLSQNNLKQIGLALHNYHDAHGRFPAAAICSKRGKPLLSWRVAILPYIEQDALYRQFKLDEPWDSEHNLKLAKTAVKTYYLPGSDDGMNGTTHYQFFVGKGAFDLVLPKGIWNITDGTSNTILVATAAKPVIWTKPDDIPFDPTNKDIHSLFRFAERDDRCSVCFGDGSVRALSKKNSAETLKALITWSDGQVVSLVDD